VVEGASSPVALVAFQLYFAAWVLGAEADDDGPSADDVDLWGVRSRGRGFAHTEAGARSRFAAFGLEKNRFVGQDAQGGAPVAVLSAAEVAVLDGGTPVAAERALVVVQSDTAVLDILVG
jgi:hypothetical protein